MVFDLVNSLYKGSSKRFCKFLINLNSNILIEKPLTSNVYEAAQIVKAAKNKKITAQTSVKLIFSFQLIFVRFYYIFGKIILSMFSVIYFLSYDAIYGSLFLLSDERAHV